MGQQSGGQPALAALRRSQVQRWTLPGLEQVRHQRPGQEWIPHWHPEWSIGAIVRGRCVCSVDGRRTEGAAGDLIAIAPGIVHTGALSAQGPYEPVCVLMFYLARPWWEEAGVAMPVGSGFVACPELAERAVDARTPDAVEGWLRRAVAVLAAALPPGAAARRPNPRARQVLWALEQGVMEGTTSVAALAQRCGLSRTRLHRVLARWTGMSPTHYLRALRLEQARVLLLQGGKPAEVACRCGFADQAHLTRSFKAAFGYTPGDLLAAADASP